MTADVAAAPAIRLARRRSNLSRLGRRLLRHRLFMVGSLVLLGLLIAVLLAAWIAPGDPNAMSLAGRFKTPSASHIFGTDNFGRDIFRRVLHGGQVSFAIGAVVAILTTIFGTLLGLVAAYFRRIEAPLVALLDAFMAFPTILLAIGVSTALGPSTFNAAIALTIVYTPRVARIVRSSAIVVGRMDYIDAIRVCGAGDARILFKHILPNCLGPIIVQVTFVFAYAVLAEAILSFLGLGAPPPVVSWGMIIADGRQYIRMAWWICLFPGLAVTLTVLGLNLVGDGLRDVLDPRIRVQPN